MRGVEFESVNICEPDGAARWVDAGRPIVPCLLVGRVASPILHVAQLATMRRRRAPLHVAQMAPRLGLEAPPNLAVTRLAWDGAAVLDAWLKLIRPLDQETLTAPTPSRGRSLRHLTENALHPLQTLR